MNTETKELSLVERAAVALKSSDTEKHLAKLAGEYKGITLITNTAGRNECHTAMMACKNARIEIEKAGKAAREDATAFSKAIIGEEKRLVAIISPEEERLAGIRDEWDTAREAERKAAEDLERKRVKAIHDNIATISQLPALCERFSIAELQNSVTELKSFTINLENFAEFTGEALQAQGKALAALQDLLTEKQAEAEEKARQEALRKAEEERMAAERAELARMRKEQEDRERIAAQERAKAEAVAKAQREAEEAVLRAQREEQRKAQAEIDRQRAEAEALAKSEREKQEAEFARQREDMRKQQEAIDAEKARLAKIEQDRIDADKKASAEIENKKAESRVMASTKTASVQMDMGFMGMRDIEVKYSYYPAEKATSLEPPAPEEWNFYSVMLGNVDLVDELTSEDFYKLQTVILEA